MGVSVTGRKLDDAKGVAAQPKTHGLRIHSHRSPKINTGGQIALMQKNGHMRASASDAFRFKG